MGPGKPVIAARDQLTVVRAFPTIRLMRTRTAYELRLGGRTSRDIYLKFVLIEHG